METTKGQNKQEREKRTDKERKRDPWDKREQVRGRKKREEGRIIKRDLTQ